MSRYEHQRWCCHVTTGVSSGHYRKTRWNGVHHQRTSHTWTVTKTQALWTTTARHHEHHNPSRYHRGRVIIAIDVTPSVNWGISPDLRHAICNIDLKSFLLAADVCQNYFTVGPASQRHAFNVKRWLNQIAQLYSCDCSYELVTHSGYGFNWRQTTPACNERQVDPTIWGNDTKVTARTITYSTGITGMM